MTIIDANNALFQFFHQQGDVFDADEHFKDIVPVSLDEHTEKQIVIASLTEFGNQKLVTRLPHKPAMFVLNRPLEQYSQTMQLPGSTASAVAEMINKICKARGESQQADSLCITNGDIRFLVELIGHLLAQGKSDGS